MKRAVGLVTVLAALATGSASAKVAATSLAQLTDGADQVLLGKVVGLHRPGGHRVAEVKVIRVLKGRRDPVRVYVFANPTWTCDISEAKKGETALFFLGSAEALKASRAFWHDLDRLRRAAPFFQIAWSGRGRMPVRQVDGVDFLTLWTSDVRLPESIQTIDGPEPRYSSFIRSARLDDVLNSIEGQIADGP